MIWNAKLGLFEWSCIVAFVILYVLFILRAIGAAKSLQSNYYRVFYKIALRTAYFALFIVALLGPSFGEMQREVKAIGKDIFIAVDLSQSMNANDIQPSRLEKLKFELKQIVNAFSSDRIGLIMFSSEAYVQCPLTYDKSALSLFIETLNTGLVPNAGTDFGPPLELALEKIDNEEETITRQTSKVIILISDGEDFGEHTGNAAKKIEEQGIKLFTLGIGTERGSKIMTQRGFKKDRNGEDVITKLNPTSLMALAKATDGHYFEINERQNDVKKMINQIDQIEGELRDAMKMDVSANKYSYFLGLAALLFLIDALIRTKTMSV